MTRRAWISSVVAALGVAGGCEDASREAPGEAATAISPLSGDLAAVSVKLLDGEIVLDGDARGVLVGAPLPGPENADPPPRFDVRWVPHDGGPAVVVGDGPVELARLLPDGRVLVTTRSLDLVAIDLSSGRGETLGEGAVGAVGASSTGAHLVYARGEMPDHEIFARGPGGGVKQVAEAMAPAWSPGVSPDGRRVFFVSARTGVPAWWRVDDGGAARQITNAGVTMKPDALPPALAPFAAGLGPTLVGGGFVVFEGEDGVHVMTEDGTLVRTVAGASSPHWLAPGRVVGVFLPAPARIVPVRLPEPAP